MPTLTSSISRYDNKGVSMKPVFVKPAFINLGLRRSVLIVSLVAISNVASPQRGGGGGEPPAAPPLSEEAKLPNGKSQRDAILKAEHEQNLKDAAQLADLAQQLQQDLEKNDTFVFSISTLKKTDDIEKLAKKIRSRLRH
jgi:hypothetical protein